MNRIQHDNQRAQRLLARVRHKQLQSAISGRIHESVRYALLACRVRRQLNQQAVCACA
ncbi:MAG: hypothetical protein WD768_19785 [Phycisphaeraceae bacterium]